MRSAVDDGPWRLRRAEPGETGLVAALLDEASAWLGSRGVRQWPARFAPDLLAPAVAAGETWLALSGGAVIGTVTVDHDDPAWSDLPGPAVYAHRLAVRRHGRGLGAALLHRAGLEAAGSGCDRLRLDCLASNPGLCRYYEDLGFRPRGTVVVGGAPGQRESGADAVRTVVRRFERGLRHWTPRAGPPPAAP